MDGIIALALAKKYTDQVGQQIISAGFKVQVEQDRSILNGQGQEKILYLLPKASGSTGDGYDEFIYAQNNWEWIGKTDVDLSDYALKTEVGDLNNLPTTDKSSLVAAVSETFTNVSSGKALVASAITDKGVQTASDATFATMAQNIEDIPTGGGTLIPKTITQNGVYNAGSDNADGYDVVTVDVPQDPDEQLIKLFTNTIEYIKIDEPCYIPVNFDSGGYQRGYANLVFFSAKQSQATLKDNTFRNAVSLKYANVGLVTLFQIRSFYINTHNLKSIVIPNPNIVAMQNTNVFWSSFIGYVWVYDSLVSGYQSATNWSVYASQIKGFSEAPIFDNSVTYSIGDVCQYNGRFYGYCKRDLTSSTGNPPTGTTDDNDYWEYVADIEVI